MKKLSAILFLILAIAAGHATLPQPDLLVRAYFAGAHKISANPNARAFTNEFCSAPAQTLRTETANKLSIWLAGWLQANNNVTAPNGATRLRPLFNDLQKAEWMLEICAAEGAKPEAAIAIKLDGEESLAWQAALKPFFPQATFTTSGGWLIFDSGTGGSTLGTTLARKILTPPAACFDLDINWPHLASEFPKLGKLSLPETAFTITAPDTSFQIEGTFFYPMPLSLHPEAWRFPTNLVHNPLISFTAVRGFNSWVQSQAWMQPLPTASASNQAFIWALNGVPTQIYAAWPVPNASAALSQMIPRLQSVIDSLNANNVVPFRYSLHDSEGMLSFIGLPMQVPYVQSVSSPAGQFLLAGGFPNLPRGQPVPPKLFERLATPDLIFYHWEITAERAPLMLQPIQLSLIGTGRIQLDANSAAFIWLTNTVRQLGNTDTEIIQTAPDQLAFHRSAPGIFTSGELYALAIWLEAKNFPGCDLQLPPPRKIKRFHPAAPIMASPASPK